MPLMFNGNIPEAIKVDGEDAQIVKYNGVTVWEKNKKLRQLPVGTHVYLRENVYTPYIVIAHDHHGSGLTTLLRLQVEMYDKFFNEYPSAANNNKYSTSRLNTVMSNLFSNLPEKTQSFIETVNVPVRESASSSTIASMSVRLFALSGMELNGSGSAEGKQISYFTNNDKRIANDGATNHAYWTRSVVPGMSTYARRVTDAGALENNDVIVNNYIRPACCVASDFVVTETNGNYYLI